MAKQTQPSKPDAPAAPVLAVAVTRMMGGSVTPLIGGASFEWEPGQTVVLSPEDAALVLPLIGDEPALVVEQVTDPSSPLLVTSSVADSGGPQRIEGSITAAASGVSSVVQQVLVGELAAPAEQPISAVPGPVVSAGEVDSSPAVVTAPVQERLNGDSGEPDLPVFGPSQDVLTGQVAALSAAEAVEVWGPTVTLGEVAEGSETVEEPTPVLLGQAPPASADEVGVVAPQLLTGEVVGSDVAPELVGPVIWQSTEEPAEPSEIVEPAESVEPGMDEEPAVKS